MLKRKKNVVSLQVKMAYRKDVALNTDKIRTYEDDNDAPAGIYACSCFCFNPSSG